MGKILSYDKQCIFNQGSDDASDNVAISTIVDDNKNDSSNNNTKEGNIIFYFVIYVWNHAFHDRLFSIRTH